MWAWLSGRQASHAAGVPCCSFLPSSVRPACLGHGQGHNTTTVTTVAQATAPKSHKRREEGRQKRQGKQKVEGWLRAGRKRKQRIQFLILKLRVVEGMLS